MGKTIVFLTHRTPGVQRAIAGAVPFRIYSMRSARAMRIGVASASINCARVPGSSTALDALDAVVVLHAEYHPEIHHVARLFLAERQHDEAIRAAWDERMDSRRNLYHTVVEWLERDRLLAPEWDLETATDVVWSLTSWQMWEQLVVDRGWSKDDYRQHLRTMLRRTLVTTEPA